MRYTIFVFALYFFTACTVPPQAHTPEAVAAPVVLPEIEVRAEREEVAKPAVKQKVKVSSSPSPCSHLPRGGDTTDEAKAKLDCMVRHLR
jgi:hypothetical protein